NIADRPGHPRAFVTGGNMVARWHVAGPWTLVARPEFYWDRNGRWTGSEQFVKAVTSTVEYKIPYKWTNTILRLEHRWDESTGAGGGFFRRGEVQPGVLSLTPNQHLVLLGILWTFDSP
ncbi:MAG TPA: porin, partial [Nitrospira sp.]|nr:porin [Nitrospira sp.]